MSDHLIVIGGAGLLGAEISRKAASLGYSVVIADFDSSSGEALLGQIREAGCNACFFQCDVSSPMSIDNLIHFAEREFGKIDHVVNATYLKGKGYGTKLPDVVLDNFKETVALQLGSVFAICQAFSKYFSVNGGGSVVNIGSIYGILTPRFSIYDGTDMTSPVEYSVTKSALRQLNRYFAQYYKKQSVRFNIVSPGGILDAQPSGFLNSYNELSGSKGMLDPLDVVDAVMFLVSDSSLYITGQDLVIDDGFSL